MFTLLLGILLIAFIIIISFVAVALLVMVETMEKGFGDEYFDEED